MKKPVTTTGRRRARQERQLRGKLDAQGAFMTRQRAAVFAYLSDADRHPTAEEVYREVKHELPKISLATVYKNLEALVACGAASKLTYTDGAARYDIRTDHHFHSRCLSCGRITDLEVPPGASLTERIKTPAGFKVADSRVELLGYCRGCKPNQS